jgi:ferric-dicitrate binding protein FerR (iron transport regulator)
MPDKRVIELLTRKMAGEATAAEIKELEQYLGTSANAQDIKEIIEDIWQSPSQEENADIFYKRHMEEHSAEFGWAGPAPGKRISLSSSPLKFYLRIAGVLAGLTVAGYLMFRLTNPNIPKKARPSEITAAKGVRKMIHLPDGTTVWLNADSRLVYDLHMHEQESRTVSLTGEAFFDVAPDKDRPFIIQTSQISIRVLGTSFNVNAYPNSGRCETTLLSGAIELSINNRPQQKIILKPSEKFALLEGGAARIKDIKPIAIDNHNYLRETSWKDNRLVFDSETFDQLKTRLERWYNVNIEIQGEKISNYRFTGIFTTETIDQALTAMKLIKPFNYKINNHEIIIY